MTTQLLFRPIPYEDESAASILIRAAEENRHTNVYQLLSGSGIQINEPSLRACLIDPPRYRLIVKSLGLTEDIAALALERVNSSRRSSRFYRSMAIPDFCFRRDDARAFCSLCLQEFPYWRQQWLVRPFSVCSRHKCLLLDRCTKCKKIPAIGRGKLTSCNHCKTSLLKMHNPSVNITSILAIEEILSSRNADALKEVLEFWIALTRFDGLDDSPAVENDRLNIAIAFLRGEVSASEHVSALVVQRMPTVGPSTQLLPFLSGSPSLNCFGEQIVSDVWPLTQIGEAESRLSYLSKSEVCMILKMTPAKLKKLITRGNINWPGDGSRQKKIAITESELRRQGFSQTEILYLYPEHTGDIDYRLTHVHRRRDRKPSSTT